MADDNQLPDWFQKALDSVAREVVTTGAPTAAHYRRAEQLGTTLAHAELTRRMEREKERRLQPAAKADYPDGLQVCLTREEDETLGAALQSDEGDAIFHHLGIPVGKELLTTALTGSLTGDIMNVIITHLRQFATNDVYIADTYLLTSLSLRGPAGLLPHEPTDLSLYNRVLLPWNTPGSHWSLFDVDLLTPELGYYDSLRGAPPPELVNTIQRWVSLRTSSPLWLARPVKLACCPVQTNTTDCGVHVLLQIEALMRNQKVEYSVRHPSIARLRIAWILLNLEPDPAIPLPRPPSPAREVEESVEYVGRATRGTKRSANTEDDDWRLASTRRRRMYWDD